MDVSSNDYEHTITWSVSLKGYSGDLVLHFHKVGRLGRGRFKNLRWKCKQQRRRYPDFYTLIWSKCPDEILWIFFFSALHSTGKNDSRQHEILHVYLKTYLQDSHFFVQSYYVTVQNTKLHRICHVSPTAIAVLQCYNFHRHYILSLHSLFIWNTHFISILVNTKGTLSPNHLWQ